MKKVLSLALSLIIASTLFTSALATDNMSNVNENQAWLDIPMYVTAIEYERKEDIQGTVQDIIETEVERKSRESISNSSAKNLFNSGTELYRIYELTPTEEMENDPLYALSISRAKNLVSAGVEVSYINFYVSLESDIRSGNNPDDPDYWEDICLPLGTYQGYTFLCLDSDIQVSTGWKSVNHSGYNWSAIAEAGVNFVFDYIIDNATISAAQTLYGTLSDFFDIFDPPLAITYSSQTDYEYHRASGPLTVRTVFISDNLDKIPGYAYYSWGTTERASINLDIDAQYPVSALAGGGYTYDHNLGTVETINMSTYGHWGNTYLFSRVLPKYLGIGYVTYSESIDIAGAVSHFVY